MRPLRFLLLAALLLAAPVRADEVGEAREHFKRGQTHYSLGEFQDAVQEFREAYRLRHQPAILFNIAQAMRQIRQYQQAHFYYQQYLAQRPDAPNRAEVEQLIGQMKKKVEAEADAERQRVERESVAPGPARSPEDHLEDSDPARSPAIQKPVVQAAATPRAPVASISQASPLAPAAAPRRSGSGRRVAGYVTVGAGLLAEGAAFALHGAAQSAADELNRKYSAGQLATADAHLRTDAESKGKLATTAFVGGAALLVTGAILSFAF